MSVEPTSGETSEEMRRQIADAARVVVKVGTYNTFADSFFNESDNCLVRLLEPLG